MDGIALSFRCKGIQAVLYILICYYLWGGAGKEKRSSLNETMGGDSLFSGK